MERDDPLLQQTVSPAHSFNVSIMSEGGRLNLNFLLAAKDRTTLSNLFTGWGLSADQVNRVLDCLIDWGRTDSLRSLNGATDADYKRAGLPLPAHRAFVSLDEVANVLSFNLVANAKPDWRESFTLWSSGPLNVNEASPELIAAVCQCNTQQAQNFVEIRNGPDKIVGTSDDVKVTDIKALQGLLSIQDAVIQQVSPQISFDDPVRRVESVGQVGDRSVRLVVVYRLGTTPLELLSWSRN